MYYECPGGQTMNTGMIKAFVRYLVLFAFVLSVALGCAVSPAAVGPDEPPLPDPVVDPVVESDSGMATELEVEEGGSTGELYSTDAPAPVLRGEAVEPMVEAAPMYKDMSMPGAPRPSTVMARTPPAESGLKAGFSDDNAQFNYFLGFLTEYVWTSHHSYDVGERLGFRVVDNAGKPVANAEVTVRDGNGVVASGLSHPDGSFRLYPAALGTSATSFEISVSASDAQGVRTASARVNRDGPRLTEIKLASPRALPDPVPLDVLFVMDTTGSMGDEIARLRSTIEIIYANLAALKPQPLVRFGMVLYRDQQDEYLTSLVPFTGDLNAFQAQLDQVSAGGGGDTPEDLESALDDAVNAMDWNEGGVRVGFIITDAEAHLDYGRQYTYIDAANDARARGIKLFSIGTGGLGLDGEYQLRQIAQLTDAKYIFLTYGEPGESEGGKPGSVSHHTGANWEAEKLEAIIIRFVKEEVAHLSDTPPEVDESYFTAQKVDDESREQTLEKLFTEALGNLLDYSSFRIKPETPLAILPVVVSGDGVDATAEYFTENLALAAAGVKRFTLVERKDLQTILAELELQLSGLVDETSAARLGGFLGADVLVSGTLYRKADSYELYLKLVRVSSAEILSVTKARVDLDLGL
jgi:Mg-chelatase subunit ChlD